MTWNDFGNNSNLFDTFLKFIIFGFFGFFCYLSNYPRHQIKIRPRIIHNGQIAIFIRSYPQSNRIPFFMNCGGLKLYNDFSIYFRVVNNPNCSFNLVEENFISELRKNFTFRYKLVPFRFRKQIDLLISTISSARECLSFQFRWCYIGSDDVCINHTNLYSYLQEINEKHNPFIDDVVFGHCINFWGLNYIQGGSGFLFSYVAISKFVSKFLFYFENQYSHFPRDEDITIGVYMKGMGYNMTYVSSSRFMGLKWNIIRSHQNYDSLPLCENKFKSGSCNDQIFKPEDIVFLHQAATKFEETISISSLFWNNSEVLYSDHSAKFPRICRLNFSHSDVNLLKT